MNILLSDILKTWDISRFKLARKPKLVRSYKTNLNNLSIPNFLDMPIKLPKENFVLPNVDSRFEFFLANLMLDIIKVEVKVNPNWNNYYCYLTCNQGEVKAGKSQRNGGAHFDGMQGARYKEKFPVCHQYLISSNNPTIYYPHGFNFDNLDCNKHNFFLECDRQKRPDKAFYAKPNALYLQSCYCVHESPIVKEDCFRSFIRVEFSLKKFNRLGNTINPNLKTNWIYENQPIPSHLI